MILIHGQVCESLFYEMKWVLPKNPRNIVSFGETLSFLILVSQSLLLSLSVMSSSLWQYELQHARLPCPPLFPRVCSNSCPLNWWRHSTISYSVVPFSSCLQSFPASGSFPISQLFESGGQNIVASASVSVLSMNIGMIPWRRKWQPTPVLLTGKSRGQRRIGLQWRLLRVLWTTRRSNQLILKEINSEYSLEGLLLKLKL